MEKEIRYFFMELLVFFRRIIKGFLKIVTVAFFIGGFVVLATGEKPGSCFIISIIAFILSYLYDRLIFKICPDDYDLFLED